MKLFNKNIHKMAAAFILSITALAATGCSSDPLEGKWSDGETILEFSTKTKKVTCDYNGQHAEGSYDFGTQKKMLVKIETWIELSTDYTDFYRDLDYTQLACIKELSDGSIMVSKLFNGPVQLYPRDGSLTDPLDGSWSITVDAETVTLNLSDSDRKFQLMEYSPDFIGMGGDENGVTLDITGDYRLEECQYIYMNFIVDGLPSGTEGTFVLSEDGKKLTIDGIEFTKIK